MILHSLCSILSRGDQAKLSSFGRGKHADVDRRGPEIRRGAGQRRREQRPGVGGDLVLVDGVEPVAAAALSSADEEGVSVRDHSSGAH